MKTLTSNSLPSLSSSEQSTWMTIYFFRPTSPFGWLVQALQWLLGAPWSAPTHVAIGYKGKLIQLFTDGISVEEDTGAAYRLCHSHYSIELDNEESIMLLSMVTAFTHLEVFFSLPEAIYWCWRVLTHRNKKYLEYNDEISYGELQAVSSGRRVFFSPPVSCTSFVWQPLADRLPIDWRVFAPAFLEQALEDLQE